ncbi:MAG: class I SAM-dependent methyltransferase [Saprospiraceae bacterium]|nr:class I SAM-dependent methyltransferase [Saprospiraceae bacterium]
MEFLKAFNSREGVYLLNEVDTHFEDHYLAIRQKENRVYTDEEVKLLPAINASNPQYQEWQIRKKSAERVVSYLNKKPILNVLDLGCGNGWFTKLLTHVNQRDVLGLDINLLELKQAARLTIDNRCKFAYGNIFTADLPKAHFDVVTINSAIQYFPRVDLLVERLFELLKPLGEVHILDSPIYQPNDVEAAKARSRLYYEEMQLSGYDYHHHSWEAFEKFNYEKLYQPDQLISRIGRKIFKNDSPFPWLKIVR